MSRGMTNVLGFVVEPVTQVVGAVVCGIAAAEIIGVLSICFGNAAHVLVKVDELTVGQLQVLHSIAQQERLWQPLLQHALPALESYQYVANSWVLQESLKMQWLHGSVSGPEQSLGPELQQTALILIAVLQLSLLRLLTLVMNSTVWLILGSAAWVEGLVQRDVRTFGGGRESAALHHLAKGLVWALVWLCIGVSLLWPWVVEPMLLMPLAISTAAALGLAVRTFKKYV